MRKALAIAFAGALLAGVATAPVGEASPTATRLTLDGLRFSPELALTPESRAVGLMHRRRAPTDGMLFVFPRDTNSGFWMKNTLVPLTIVFFDAQGVRVRKLSMTTCLRKPCPIYTPGRRYRFALELAASDTRSTQRLGPLWRLERLSRSAT